MGGQKSLILEGMTMILALSACARFPVIEYNGAVHEGEATYYEDGLLGNCSYPPDTRPAYHGAMNRTDYAGSRACGAYVTVRRKNDPRKREVTVLIDNQCPECAPGDIDLSPSAFERVADRVEGRVAIEWNYVAAPAAGPLRYRWKEGSSRWWFQILVMNHQYAVSKMEMQAPGTDWVALKRKEHNYWEARNGIGKSEGPFNIRTTDVMGHTMTDYNLAVMPGRIIDGECKDKGPLVCP